MNAQLETHLQRFTRQQLIDIMWAALDEMQSHNGQSRTSALMRAIGADGDGEGSWNLPTLAEAVRNTQGASALD